MKIMQIVTSIDNESAGPSHSVPGLCEALQRNGCDVTLYTLGEIPNKKYNFKIKSYPTESFPAKALGRSPKMFKALMEEASSFDLIHSHMLWMSPNYYAGFVALKYNLPLIIAPRGTLSKWAVSQSRLKKALVLAIGQKKALNAVDCFHATAESECNDIAEYGYSKVKCIVSPNGLQLPKFVGERKGIKKRVVFMSRLHPKKGLDMLINGWSKLEQKFQDWELSIIGPLDSTYAVDMQKLSDALGCKKVHFLGELKGSDKFNYLRDSSLFILPTHSENFGMVVAEALASEIPVICTKGAPWKKLEDFNAGWWIDINEEAIVQGLTKAMLLDENTLKKMGKNGRKWIEKDFSWDAIAVDLIKVYKQVILDKETS